MKLAFSTNAFTGGDYTVVEAIEQIGAARSDGMRYAACEIRRSLIPVRVVIHSSLVSTICSRS